jgi:outer membrane receptor protein involved in Fe transport
MSNAQESNRSATQEAGPANTGNAATVAGQEGDAATMETVVVTGTSQPRRRFDAAYAHSIITAPQIDVFAPLNAVELFGKLAGFASEPSGGEGGNNVNVRGLPVSNFLFVPILQDGLPVFQETQEAFLNADELTRIDLMTDRVESVRGGTSPIYTSNAPGATVNFITRKGTPAPHGMVRGTIGDYGLLRFDGAWTGPIGRGWLLSMGGYYRRDDGLRKPGFTADRGGQFRVNLTRTLRDGELNLYAGRLDDRTIFYLPVPLADPRAPGRSLSHLLDPRTGTLTSNDFRNVRIRTLDGTPGGAIRNEDLADGVYPRVTVVGASLDWRLANGWTLQDKVRYTDGSVKFNALFSLTPPDDAAAFQAAQLGRARAGFGPAVDRLAYVLANARGPGGSRVPFDPAGTDGLVIRGGWWSVDTTFSNFMNDFRLSREWTGIGPGSHTLTGGLYFSDYRFRQSRLFNSMLMEMRDRPRALDLIALDQAGNTLGSVTENGFLDYGNNSDMGGAVDGRLWALYVADEWKLSERLRLDAGVRHQSTRQDGYAVIRATRNLGDPATLADDNVGGPSSSVDRRREHFRGTAWTLGANYEFTPAFGTFARFTSSFRTPALSNIYLGATQAPAFNSSVRQAEVGTKHRFPGGAAYATVFWNRFKPLRGSALTVDPSGQVVSTNFVSTTENYGVEFEGTWRVVPRLELTGSLTLQNPRYESLADLSTGQAIPGVEGNQIRRFPKVFGSFTPTLDVDLFGYRSKGYATLSYQGKRYVDSNNSTRLPAYTTLDAGLIVDLDSHLRLQVAGSNLTNEIGLTEGNPRTDALVGQGTSDAIYARPIFGRTLRLSLTYSW